MHGPVKIGKGRSEVLPGHHLRAWPDQVMPGMIIRTALGMTKDQKTPTRIFPDVSGFILNSEP